MDRLGIRVSHALVIEQIQGGWLSIQLKEALSATRAGVETRCGLDYARKLARKVCGTFRVQTFEEIGMLTKLRLGTAILAVCVTLAVMAGGARAQEIPLVTGEHWTRSSEEVKKAYLVGMANIVHVEMAFEGASPVPDTQSMLPRMVKGLKGHNLDTVREALNKWYAANPDKLQRPVIETIWFEMVVPGLRNPK
jgi:hypothetical protein